VIYQTIVPRRVLDMINLFGCLCGPCFATSRNKSSDVSQVFVHIAADDSLVQHTGPTETKLPYLHIPNPNIPVCAEMAEESAVNNDGGDATKTTSHHRV